MTLGTQDLARYSRHIVLPEVGLSGQEKLQRSSALIVGAGGLGSPAALYLAASGVGHIGLVDFDRVDISNLQRQVLFDTAHVGESKAELAKKRLLALNPGIAITAYASELRAANAMDIMARYDVVLDGSDRLGTRYLVNDACVLLRKPLVTAAIHRFEGQATTCIPGRGPCYRCLFPNANGAVAPNCAEAGVLGVLPGVLGTIQATEAIKILLGIGSPLSGRLLTYDALSLEFNEFHFSRRPDCAVCGDHPSITALRDLEPSCAVGVAMLKMTPKELAAQLASASAEPITIIDVREPDEFAVGALPDSINIPLGTLPQRLNEIPADAIPVFVCRMGGRSLRGCAIAQAAGHERVVNLEGGLTAWAAQVDNAFPLD
jgi:sulfur-carrier protein adenylyltransferase/sulfurtransferase